MRYGMLSQRSTVISYNHTKMESYLADSGLPFMEPQWVIPPVKTLAFRPHKYGRWALLGLEGTTTGRKAKELGPQVCG
jgi:hypothetical protein